MKNIVELAIDAAEAALVLGSRALCVITGLTESPQQNVHVDNVYAGARPVPPPLYYREHFADCGTPEAATEASPEVDAGQPLASVATLLTADDLESAAFACRKYAEAAVFEAARPHWLGIADRVHYSAAIARQFVDAANE